jgi:RNA polymerase sigma factor (sigma-70 family)
MPSEQPARALPPDDLLRACLRGEDAAWRLFLERYGDLMYSVPLKMGVRRSDAEEIFQTTLVAIYQRLGTLKDPARLVNWISEIARRQTLYYLRKRSREVAESEEGLPDTADRAPLALQSMESLEASQVVHEALLGLAPRCRELIVALYLTDPPSSYKALAQRYGIAIGTVGPTRAHCLKALRAALAARGYREPAAPRRGRAGARNPPPDST